MNPSFPKIHRVKVTKVLAPAKDERLIEMWVKGEPSALVGPFEEVSPKNQILVLDWLSSKVWRSL